MSNTRTKNSITNIVMSFVVQFSSTIFSFIVRTVFIYQLDKQYLGMNGLFSDILTLLSLAELGVGTAIVYSMYEPFAKRDYKKTSQLLTLYKQLYNKIGIVIAIVGLSITPFIKYLITDLPNMDSIYIIYWLYLLNTVVSYFYVYKRSILLVDQKIRIESYIRVSIILIQSIVQITVIFVTHSFIMFLMTQIFCSFLNNYIISKYVDKKYDYIINYHGEEIDEESKKVITKNIFYMFFSKLSSAIVTSTDNILISTFVSTVTLGLYSNYLIFVSLIKQVIAKVFEGVRGSVGNLISLESSGKSYEVFDKLFFINFILSGYCTSLLYVVVNTFISFWIGNDFLLNEEIVILICINLYMRTIRETQLTYIDTYGLFKDIRWKCIAEASINLVVSVIFVYNLKMGTIGVLLGTFVSNLITNFWIEPVLLYTRRFNVSYIKYFFNFFVLSFSQLIIIFISMKLITFITINNLLILIIIKFLIVTILNAILYGFMMLIIPRYRFVLQFIKFKKSM